MAKFSVDARGRIIRNSASPGLPGTSVTRDTPTYDITAGEVTEILALDPTDPVRITYLASMPAVRYNPQTGQAIAPDGNPVSGGGNSITPPAGFDFPFSTYPVTVSKRGNVYTTDFVPEAYIPAACWTGNAYHVDPVAGNDANTGIGAFDGDFSAATAVKSIQRAVTLGNTSAAPYRIFLKGGATFTGQLAWSNATGPSQRCAIIALGGRALVSTHEDNTWADDASGNNTYSTSATASTPTVAVSRVFDIATRNQFGDYTELTAAASLAACRSTPGTFFADTTTTPNTLSVHRADNAAVTNANTRAHLKRNPFGCLTLTANTTMVLYVQDVDFEGGNNTGCFYADIRNTGAVVVLNRCTGRYSTGGAATGLKVMGGAFAAMIGCTASANYNDGLCTQNNSATSTPPPAGLVVDCVGYDNGRGSNQSCNGFTTHAGARTISVNGRYQYNYGADSAHVTTTGDADFTKLWVLGDICGPGKGNPPGGGTYKNQGFWNGSCTVWLDGVKAFGSTGAITTDDNLYPGVLGTTYVKNVVVVGAVNTKAGATYAPYT